MRIHFLIHESYESPGAIETWAKDRGHALTYTRFHQGEPLPASADDVDFLIIMGGPQSPATTEAECPHFHAKAEIDFIRKVIGTHKSVLGVCLGAQLIGEAMGATFAHSPEREIGVFDLMLTDEAQDDPIFSSFPQLFPVGHWHGDMPGLTPEAVVLATSQGCPRQVIRYTPKVYGFQCHFEFTPENIEALIENNAAELEAYKDHPYVQPAEILRSHNYAAIHPLLFLFLDALTELKYSPT